MSNFWSIFVFSDTPILVWFWTYSWIVSELFLIIFWIISGPLPCDLDVPSDVIPRSCFLVVLTVLHAAMFQNMEKVEVVSKIGSFFSRNISFFFETNRINLAGLFQIFFVFFQFFLFLFFRRVFESEINQKTQNWIFPGFGLMPEEGFLPIYTFYLILDK